MSSSTMMKAPTMSRASHARKTKEARTSATSQAHGGTRRRVSAKLDLGEAARDLARLGGLGLDADVGRRLAHLPQHRIADRGPACRLLERGGVELGDAVEVVLAAGKPDRRPPHLLAHVRTRHEQLERG